MRGMPFRPTRLQLALVMLPVLALAGFIVLNGQFAQADSAPNYVSLASQSGQANAVSTGRVEGIPAIKPRAELAATRGAHYVEADVRQYLATTYSFPYKVPGSARPTVTSVQFLSAGAVSAQMHVSMDMPDTALLCLVHVSGSFLYTDVPLGVHPSKVYHDAVLLFDAQTGNLLSTNA